MKIHSVGTELFHVDEQPASQLARQTDMMKLIAAFCNFAITSNNIENKYYLLLLKRSKSVPVFSL
jgi:hypothetical protein